MLGYLANDFSHSKIVFNSIQPTATNDMLCALAKKTHNKRDWPPSTILSKSSVKSSQIHRTRLQD